jgi:aminopeptidase YwaD
VVTSPAMSRLDLAAVFAAVVSLACATKPTPDGVPPTETPAASGTAGTDADLGAVASADISASQLRPHVEFLADDAQNGRAPGTEDDVRVQAYVEAQMKEIGLRPEFGATYRQPFQVTDGVRLREGQASTLAIGKSDVPHAIVPFAGTGEAKGKLVFVGYGLAPEGKGTGDYAKIAAKVKGAIVVALEGPPPDDPHVSPAAVRPQQKLINARDHGAVGFVLWEPTSERPWPNHGEASDLQIPAVWVGKTATEDLRRALGAGSGKGGPADLGLKVGSRSTAVARVASPVEPIVRDTANVAGRLPGSGTSSRVLVVGAHMDHLGLGTSSSLAPGVHDIHNGADDNASGVSVVLEMARALAAMDARERAFDVVFIAFGAEEMGLIGSKHYVRSLGDRAGKDLVAMLNFDMVGRLGDEGVVIAGTGTSTRWPEILKAAAGDLAVRTTDDGYGPSDHGSFYEAGVPVLHFFTGSHEDYHKPSDDIGKINFDGAARIGNLALAIARRIEAEAIEPDYVKVARKEAARGGFRVSLGTIPDYGANVDGVRLSGVREGGPAAVAGLQKGDVIVELGGRPVHNLDDYMAVFVVLEPGKEIDVAVTRDGDRKVMKLTPAAPGRR